MSKKVITNFVNISDTKKKFNKLLYERKFFYYMYHVCIYIYYTNTVQYIYINIRETGFTSAARENGK